MKVNMKQFWAYKVTADESRFQQKVDRVWWPGFLICLLCLVALCFFRGSKFLEAVFFLSACVAAASALVGLVSLLLAAFRHSASDG